MPRELKDSVVVITGASAGIGLALAVALHIEGAKLVLAARRIEKLEQLNARLGKGHLCLQVDVSRQLDCEELIEHAIEHFGHIDTLICNAGFGLMQSLAGTSPQQMRELFNTNVFGTTDCISAAVPHMMGNDTRHGYRGQIVIVSSAAARRGMVYMGPYSATKAAQLSLAEALRVELASAKIAVTSVHPITTRTDFFDAAEALSGTPIDVHSRGLIVQEASLVARKIVRVMRKPRRELWPYVPVRPLLTLNAALPVLGDWVMRYAKRQMDRKK